MKRLLQRARVHFKGSRRIGTLEVMTWAVSANAAAALAQHLTQIAAGAISDCIGAQILQSVPLLAAMNSGGFDYDSIATQVAAALIGSALLSIFPGMFSKLRPRRLSAHASASIYAIAIA
jgi:hypothetical protein